MKTEVNRKIPCRTESQTGRVVLLLLVVALLLTAGLFQVWVKTQVLNYGYELNSMSRKRHALMAEGQKLELKLAKLKAQQKIKLASKGESLKQPEPHQIRVLELTRYLAAKNRPQTYPKMKADNTVPENKGSRLKIKKGAFLGVFSLP